MKTFLTASFIFCLSFCSTAQYTQYWYGNLHTNVTIKDAEYYKRLDAIAQQKADAQFEMLKKSNEYYDKGDYESCIHYATQALDFDFYKGSAWCNIAASYAQLDKRHKARKAYSKGYNRMDPEMRRSVQNLYKEKFGRKLRRRRFIGRKVAIAVFGTALVAGAATAVVLYANGD